MSDTPTPNDPIDQATLPGAWPAGNVKLPEPIDVATIPIVDPTILQRKLDAMLRAAPACRDVVLSSPLHLALQGEITRQALAGRGSDPFAGVTFHSCDVAHVRSHLDAVRRTAPAAILFE